VIVIDHHVIVTWLRQRWDDVLVAVFLVALFVGVIALNSTLYGAWVIAAFGVCLIAVGVPLLRAHRKVRRAPPATAIERREQLTAYERKFTTWPWAIAMSVLAVTVVIIMLVTGIGSPEP
jgi:hypothetical protein